MYSQLDLPTGNVTFLFSDIQGSTPLWERNPEAMGLSLSRHNEIMGAAIQAHGGIWFKSVGDEIQAAFRHPLDALQAAVDGQRGLQSAQWGETGPILVRMGIHFGDAVAETTDYATTHTLNRVARIMSSAHGGQIVISQEAVDSIGQPFPAEITLKDMGKHRMKGLSQLEHIFQVQTAGLPDDFPPLKTLDISPNNLPAQLNRFIGREREIAAVRDLLKGARLVTLTGSGGAGKTRLSLEVAESLQEGHPDGVWLVELAPQSDPELVPRTVLTALELAEDPGRSPLGQLTDFLEKRTLLLVLDNCEHLIDACARLAEHLLRCSPHLRILASSREALGIPGEMPFRVPSMAVPEPEAMTSIEAFKAVEAVRLFIERASAAKPHFALTAENAPTIAHICKRLDGIPLAIELAAARIKIMEVEQIYDRLDNRFRLLTGGSRTALPRQQTLRALIDWSYSLLSEPEKTLLRRLSVFVGGLDLEAAEAVCAGGEIEPFDVLDLLTNLVDKSLVNTEETAFGIRYRRLETIRQYAREKFQETDEVRTLRDAHLAYFMERAETAETGFRGPKQLFWINYYFANLENINAAITWAAGVDVQSGLRLFNALEPFLYIKFDSRQGHRWFPPLLAQADETLDPAVHAKALRIAMSYLWTIGDVKNKDRYLEQSLALYQSIQDEVGIAHVMLHKAWALTDKGELDEAEQVFLDCLEAFKRNGDNHGQMIALSQLASQIHATSNTPLAKTYAENALALVEISRDLHAEIQVLEMLAMLSYYTENFDEAFDYLERSRRLNQDLFQKETPNHTYNQARIYYMKGDYEMARSLYQKTIETAERAGQVRDIRWATLWLGKIAVREHNLEEAYQIFQDSLEFFQNFHAMGVVITIEWVAELAMALDRPRPAAAMIEWADIQRKKIGDHRPAPEQKIVDHLMKEIGTRLDAQAVSEAQALGKIMSEEDAVAFALQETKSK